MTVNQLDSVVYACLLLPLTIHVFFRQIPLYLPTQSECFVLRANPKREEDMLRKSTWNESVAPLNKSAYMSICLQVTLGLPILMLGSPLLKSAEHKRPNNSSYLQRRQVVLSRQSHIPRMGNGGFLGHFTAVSREVSDPPKWVYCAFHMDTFDSSQNEVLGQLIRVDANEGFGPEFSVHRPA